MINIHDLSKSYKNIEVLNIPSLFINKGERIGLVGNNGAGKTTLLRLLLDLETADTGLASINDENVATSENFKSITGAYLDKRFLIEYLKAEEYFAFVGDARGWTSSEVNVFLDNFSDVFNNQILSQRKYLRDFSTGNQKKVGLIASLIGDPELIIWDEPFASLDPSTQLKIKEIMNSTGTEKTWLVSSHDLNIIYDISSRIIMLRDGHVHLDVLKSDMSKEEMVSKFL